MARVTLVHWNEAEAEALAGPLRGAGYQVEVRWLSNGGWKADRESLPDALVISLERLPSHGREVARWFWEAKYRRSRPVLFCGGAPEKVAALREEFPAAAFCAVEALPGALPGALAGALDSEPAAVLGGPVESGGGVP